MSKPVISGLLPLSTPIFRTSLPQRCSRAYSHLGGTPGAQPIYTMFKRWIFSDGNHKWAPNKHVDVQCSIGISATNHKGIYKRDGQ